MHSSQERPPLERSASASRMAADPGKASRSILPPWTSPRCVSHAVGAEVAGTMIRSVGAALTVLVACCAPASAAASATVITTIIVGCIVHGMRERPRSVKVRHERAHQLRPRPKLLTGVMVLALAVAPAAQAAPVMSGDPQTE